MKNFLIKQLQEQFNQAQIQGTRNVSLRNGYFYIIGMQMKELKLNGLIQSIPIANVNWRPEEDRNGAFLEDAVFEVALSSLYTNYRTEQAPDYTQFLQKVLYIYDTKLEQTVHNGKPRAILTCKWKVLDGEPTFKNSSSLLMASIWGNASNLGEVAARFEDGDIPDDGTNFHHEPLEDEPTKR